MRETKRRGDFRLNWIVILLFFAIFLGFFQLWLFWPIGIYLVIRKLSGQRSTRSFEVMALVFGLLSCAWGLEQLADALRHIFTTQSGFSLQYFSAANWGLSYILVGLLVLLARRVIMDRDKRYAKYEAVIGSRYYMPVDDIAGASGTPERKAKRDLSKMIEKGYFGDTAFIDERGEYFLRSSYAYTLLKKERGEREEPQEEKREASEAESPDEFQTLLREIRLANDRIVDSQISEQIDRIEAVTAQIFKSVSDSPEKLPQIRSFLNYYLPTTLKLMNAYSQLERQGINGENITAAKENIQDIMGRLVTGFEKQLDELYKEDVLDISSDIQVLEHMMQKDGLSGAGDDFKTEDEKTDGDMPAETGSEE